MRYKKILGIKTHAWYSICSRHHPDGPEHEDCKLCNIGNWVFIPGQKIGYFFHKNFYRLWFWYNNTKRGKIKFLNSFRNLKTGKKENPFPNLK